VLPKEFNYQSRDWALLREFLKDQLETTVGGILNSDCPPARADQLRGRAAFIKLLLAGEQAAQNDRLNGGNLNGN
jgi:hypothetical protein